MHFSHTPGTHTGYSRYGTKLEAAVQGLGYRTTPLAPGVTPEGVAVWVTTPNHARGWYDGQWKVLSTMWETMSLPEGFREGLHNFEQLVVPSAHNLELFQSFHENVYQVPLGVDGWEWRPRPRRPPTNRFVFLVCGNGARKGVDLAVKAFQKLFNGGSLYPRPVLQIKSASPVDAPLGTGIQHISGFLSDSEEQELYAQAHCFLAPSRGEGFGLQPLQAIASGLPTVLTDAHGHAGFARLGWPIPAGRSKADYFLHGDGGEWWEPDLDALCGRMEQIYRSYDVAAKQAADSAEIAHQLFSWARCAEAFVDSFAEHLDQPYGGKGEWQTPELKRYPVRLSRFWACSVAGADYQFYPGVDYYETADVKRILFEQNLLDPSCVDPAHPDATGLTEAQLARLGEYTASRSYCHACGQILNSGVRYDHP